MIGAPPGDPMHSPEDHPLRELHEAAGVKGLRNCGEVYIVQGPGFPSARGPHVPMFRRNLVPEHDLIVKLVPPKHPRESRMVPEDQRRVVRVSYDLIPPKLKSGGNRRGIY